MKTPMRIPLKHYAVSTCVILLLFSIGTRHAEPVSGAHEPPPPHELSEESFHRVFFQANQSYMKGDYEEAARLYEHIIASGHANGHIYYNLANCHIRLNHVGDAILHYQRALLLIPRDEDCKANLRYARSQALDKIEGSEDEPFVHSLAFWYFGLNFREMIQCFLVFHTLFWLSALLRLYRDREWVKWVFTLSLILSIVMGLSGALKYRDTRSNPLGVVLAKETPVRSGYTDHDTVLYLLHDGTEFRIIGEEKDWYKIRLKDGKKGWIKKEHVGRAALPV